MELEQTSAPFEPVEDKRPRLEIPPPVRLVAVEDCSLRTIAGLEKDLDDFYTGLLQFERIPDESRIDGGEAAEPAICYRAENFRLQFRVLERSSEREDLRPLGIAVPSLAGFIQRLIELEIDYIRQRGLTPGVQSVLIADPAGNPLEITEFQIAI